MINAPHVALSSINPPYIFHNNHVSKECQLQLQVATFQDCFNQLWELINVLNIIQIMILLYHSISYV